MDPFMEAAIAEAQKSFDGGGIPIGSVLVYENKILGRGHNERLVGAKSPIIHGEMAALQNAGRLPANVYKNSVIYTTLSPCVMCSGAIRLFGIPEVVIGENQTFMGDEALLASSNVKLTVLQDERCIDFMTRFIAAHPEEWNEDIGEV